MRARLLLLAAGLAAFGGSLFAGFHFDDYAIFSPALLRPLTRPHPLTRFTFWLNDEIGGQQPIGYHLFNLLLHVCAVLLAYECLRRLLPPTAAIFAAAIFAIHPLQAEAVNYVAARGVLLAATLCLAALLAWLEDQPWLALLAFAAALLADDRCALFPTILILCRPPSKRLTKIALAVTFALAFAAVIQAPIAGYAFALVSLRFLRLLLLPWGFTISPDIREPLCLALTSAVLVSAGAVWQLRKPGRVKSEIAWLLSGLLLLIPIFSGNPAGDPRMYLPLFAFAAAAGLLLNRIPSRGVAAALIVILTAVSVSRTYVWMSDERLWREAVRGAPNQAEPKIQLARSVRAAEALELLNGAREQAPYNPEIPAEIGRVLLDEQQFEGAVEELSRAVALNPKNALAFNNRGVALAALGQSAAAVMDLQHALVLDPNLSEAGENLKRLGVK